MARLSVRKGLLAFASFLLACQPPYAVTHADATFVDDALVVHATAEDSSSWSTRFVVADAPAGEYEVFTSLAPPTSLAGLASVDLAACEETSCVVPELGTLYHRVVHEAPGELKLGAGLFGVFPSEIYVVVVRRGAAAAQPLRVAIVVDIETGGGCATPNPDPPDVTTSSLGGAPPLPNIPTVADGGRDVADDAADPRPDASDADHDGG